MIKKSALLLLPLAFLAACSGNGSSFKEEETEETSGLNGRVDNRMSGARVTLVELTTNGQPAREFDDSDNYVFAGYFARSASTGAYELTYEASSDGKPVLVIATADSGSVSYICESPSGCGNVGYLGDIAVDDDLDIRAGVGELASDMTINVNWLTDLASSLATTVYIDASPDGDVDAQVDEETDTALRSFYSEYSIELANKHVSALFNVSDVIYVTPIGPSSITTPSSLPSAMHQQAIYEGAIISALANLAANDGKTYVQYVNAFTEEFIKNKGQLLERSADDTGITLYGLLNQAYQNLRDNINYYKARGATVPEEANRALSMITSRINSLVVGRETSVTVDVDAELADWKTNIDQAKVFITDLVARFQDFTGQETGTGFIDTDYSNRMDAYFTSHNTAYDNLAPSLNTALYSVIDMVQYLLSCESTGGCDNPAYNPSGLLSYSAAESRVSTTQGTLTLTLANITDDTVTIELNDGGALDLSSGAVTWKTAANSIDVETRPNIVLQYADDVTEIQSWAALEPTNLYVLWPSVKLPLTVAGTAWDSAATNSVEILFETSLIGVKDPMIDQTGGSAPALDHSAYEQRFNVYTAVLWVCSLSVSGAGCADELDDSSRKNVLLSEIITVNAAEFYPDTKWPEFSDFFEKREVSDSETPEQVPGMLTMRRGIDADGKEYLDTQVLDGVIRRMHVYASETISGATVVENCDVDALGGSVISNCDSSPIIFAESFGLEQWLQDLYDADALQLGYVRSHGSYVADISALVSGGDVVIPSDQNLGPYDGTLTDQYQLTVGNLNLQFDSLMPGTDQTATTLVANLVRQTKNYFDAEVRFGYNYDYEVSGIYAGADAQSFSASFSVTYDETSDLNVEIGSLVVFRSGVTLFGSEEALGLTAAYEANYTRGSAEASCGIYNRDELVSDGDCDAVAYITYRGALLGSIREERPGVFVVRYVDGTWTILGS